MNQTFTFVPYSSRKVIMLASLVLLWLATGATGVFAQETALQPISGSLYGNYCTATGGIGLRDDPFSGSFAVNVPGTPVAAYWYWSGRTAQAPQQNDPQISVALNGGAATIITADQSLSSPVTYGDQVPRAWHTNVYQDVGLSLVVPNAVNNFTVAELNLNGPAINFENHGTGVLIIYESPACPFQKVDVNYGLDSSHHSQQQPLGPDSDVFCTTFAPSTQPQTFSIDMFIGGVAADTRGNSIWYITGSGTPNFTTLVDNPSATEVLDPLNATYQLEWDMYVDDIAIAAGDTYACFQIESPEQNNGASSVWMGAATGITLPPPSIVITKTPDIQTVTRGADATFTIAVENTSPYELSNVAVTDPLSLGCEQNIGVMNAGAVSTFTCSAVGVTTSFTNTAFVTGLSPFETEVSDQDDAQVFVADIDIVKTPDLQTVSSGSTVTFTIQVTNIGDVALNNVTVTDALTPACNQSLGTLDPGQSSIPYSCVATNVTAGFINEAVAVGQPANAAPVTASDTAEVQVVNPAIDIQKTPDTQTIVAGASATFTIQVTNIGNVTLTNVAVVDPLVAQCDNEWASLAPGESQTYTCTADAVQAAFTNTASVSGTAPDGTIVSDSDIAEVLTQGPSIDIQKTPDLQTVLSGDPVVFTIRVENNGDVALTNVTISDPLVPACDIVFASMTPGQVESYQCTLASAVADFTNVASVTGTSPTGATVSDTDDAAVNVESPFIAISKTPDTQTVLAGAPVQFTIVVTNTGSVDLLNVTVVDGLTTDCNRNLGTLAPNVPVTYQCTLPSAVASFTNVAIVTGDPAMGGPQVTDSDTAEVIVIQPAITISKTPDNQIVVSGNTASFTIRVENTGTVDLINVIVSDPLAPACDRAFAQMAVGAVEEYPCQLGGVVADFINVASVTGTPPMGPNVTAQDGAVVDVISPAIEISKSPDLQLVAVGGSVDFTILVTNIGDTPLTNVVVSDPLAPDCNQQIGDLGVGLSSEYICTMTNISGDLTNTATVVGQPPAGDTVIDQDTAAVTVISPSISIDKSVVQADIQSGENATFSIIVVNTGDVVLNNVVVTDALTPDCDRTIGILTPNQSTTYTCTQTNVQESFVNVAVVSGVPPVGPNVTDEDAAAVTVPLADLRVSKTDGGAITQPGGTILYTLTYENVGAGNAFDVVITEVVPEFTTFNLNASTQGWACDGGSTAAGTVCTFAVGDLAAGASGAIDLVFVVNVDPALSLETTQINNIVTISGRNDTSVSGNNTGQESTPIPPTGLEEVTEPARVSQPAIFIPLISSAP